MMVTPPRHPINYYSQRVIIEPQRLLLPHSFFCHYPSSFSINALFYGCTNFKIVLLPWHFFSCSGAGRSLLFSKCCHLARRHGTLLDQALAGKVLSEKNFDTSMVQPVVIQWFTSLCFFYFVLSSCYKCLIDAKSFEIR